MGVFFGDEHAHFFRLHRGNPDVAMTTCGQAIAKPMLYHPGNVPLCRHCAKKHPPPNLDLHLGIIVWANRWHGRREPPAELDRRHA